MVEQSADSSVDSGRPVGADRLRRMVERTTQAAKRARNTQGPERETVFLLLKSALAGVLAWIVAEYVVASPQPTYAPFTALLVVQSTAYRSVLQTVRYVAAVILGVLAAGAAGPLLGANPGGFAAMLAVALLVGRWPRLGSQGIQVAVAAVFAYNAISGTREVMLWEILGMTLAGAAIGLTVAMLVLPPLRYRDAAQGIMQVSWSLRSLLTDVADGLRDGMPERDVVVDWLRRARQLDATVASARQAVETGSESVVWNPRRLFRRRSTPVSFAGYRTLVEALARAGEQMRSICYALLRMIDDEESPYPGEDFLDSYADLLEVVARAPESIGATAGDSDQRSPLEAALEDGRQRYRQLARDAPTAEAWPTYGVLLTDADRLLDEFSHAHQHGGLHPPAERG